MNLRTIRSPTKTNNNDNLPAHTKTLTVTIKLK